jgi:hypothetical protein
MAKEKEMVKKSDYKNMSIEDLEKLNQDLMNQREAIKEEQRKIAAVLDEKCALRDAQRKAETMSDPEKAALLQILKPEGIRSEEKVGEPGT